MLPFVLAPGPDETLYSIIARHGVLLGRGDASDLTSAFLGRSSNVVSVDSLCGLDYAAQALGLRDGLEVTLSHTAYPYDMFFANAGHRQAVEAWIRCGQGRHRGAIGVMAMILRPRSSLAFCDQCVRADRDGSGIHRWRRSHQLSGVFVCHRHGDPLRISQVDRGNHRGTRAFVALSDSIIQASKKARIPRDDLETLRAYAGMSARLLEADRIRDLYAIQKRFHELLVDFRWDRANSLIAMSKLVSAITCHPKVKPLIRAMDIKWSENALSTALNRLLYRDQASKHPLLVLVLLQTLGANLDDLFTPPKAAEPIPFSVRPVEVADLCNNRACNKFQPEAILSLFLKGDGMQRAICSDCKFAVRAGSKGARAPIILRTCPSWDAMVAHTLSDPGKSIGAAMREFGASRDTLLRAALRCDLWRQEWTSGARLLPRAQLRSKSVWQKHRRTWLVHSTGAAANLRTNQFPKPIFNAYRYLLRTDREWLNGHRSSPLS